MRCPYCGAEIPDEDQFCGDCGRRVREVPVAAPVSAPVQAAPQAPARRGGAPVALIAAVGVLLLVVIAGGAWALGLFSPGGSGDGGGGPTPPPGAADPLHEILIFVVQSADESMIYALANRDDSMLDAFFTGPELQRQRANVADLRAKDQTIESTLEEQRDWVFDVRDDQHATVQVTEVWSRRVLDATGNVISEDHARTVTLVFQIEMVNDQWKVASINPR